MLHPIGQSFGTVLLGRQRMWPEQRSKHFKTGSINALPRGAVRKEPTRRRPVEPESLDAITYANVHEYGQAFPSGLLGLRTTLAMPPPRKPCWSLVLTILCASLSFVAIVHVSQLSI